MRLLTALVHHRRKHLGGSDHGYTTRRAGRSTIIKRPDGRWHGYVSMGTKGDGKRDRRHVSAATRGEVVKGRELEAKRDAGVVTPPASR